MKNTKCLCVLIWGRVRTQLVGSKEAAGIQQFRCIFMCLAEGEKVECTGNRIRNVLL